MTTTIANPIHERSKLRKLRTMAEKQAREVAEKMAELNAFIERLNTVLGETRPQPSPLDGVHDLLKVTEDLRSANGKLSATAIARAFGVSVNQLAAWLGRSRQALAKTPDADSLQNELAFFERVARLRAVVSKERFLKWLRMTNSQLDGKQPLDILAAGKGQIVADLVDDMLTGAPA